MIFLNEFIWLNVNVNMMIKMWKLNISIAAVFLDIQTDDLIEYKRLCCDKNYKQRFDKNLKERFFNTYKFSNHGNNKFILSLGKSVFPSEYMDKTSFPEKEDFYIHLNIEDITDTDYAHA